MRIPTAQLDLTTTELNHSLFELDKLQKLLKGSEPTPSQRELILTALHKIEAVLYANV